MRRRISQTLKQAVTLLELLVVVLIISILASIATGVYTGEAQRARIAATKDLIRQLEIAITRYEVDLGQYPPTGSGTVLPPGTSRTNGTGYLHVALRYSMSGNANAPSSPLWRGPYINLRADQVQAPSVLAVAMPAEYNILDAWRTPMLYVESSYYAEPSTSTYWAGTELFPGTLPRGGNPDLPAPNPFIAQGETFYNTSGYQIISFGPNRTTVNAPYHGTEIDDVTNFGF